MFVVDYNPGRADWSEPTRPVRWVRLDHRHSRIPGFVLTDHQATVPLDHSAPDDGRMIEVFAREIVPPGASRRTFRGLQLETARHVGNVRTWVTNEFEHDGLRADPARVLGRLTDIRAGRV